MLIYQDLETYDKRLARFNICREARCTRYAIDRAVQKRGPRSGPTSLTSFERTLISMACTTTYARTHARTRTHRAHVVRAHTPGLGAAEWSPHWPPPAPPAPQSVLCPHTCVRVHERVYALAHVLERWTRGHMFAAF